MRKGVGKKRVFRGMERVRNTSERSTSRRRRRREKSRKK
jgi:hypothetical protein